MYYSSTRPKGSFELEPMVDLEKQTVEVVSALIVYVNVLRKRAAFFRFRTRVVLEYPR